MTPTTRDKTHRREASPIAVNCFMFALARAGRKHREAEGYLLDLITLLVGTR